MPTRERVLVDAAPSANFLEFADLPRKQERHRRPDASSSVSATAPSTVVIG
jgi:hypothetical protein